MVWMVLQCLPRLTALHARDTFVIKGDFSSILHYFEATQPRHIHFVHLVCSEGLKDHAILTQVNCTCRLKHELEKEDNEDSAAQKVSAVEADEHQRVP